MNFRILALLAVGLISFGISDALATNQVTLDTDKGTYAGGDTVTITGTVANSPDQLVAIEVKDPSGNILVLRTVQTDSSGNYVLKFKLPPSAPSGNYDIVANSKINGVMVTETKTIVQTSVIPEFGSIVGIAIIVSVIGAIVISRPFSTTGLTNY